jgi:hypothetical protein
MPISRPDRIPGREIVSGILEAEPRLRKGAVCVRGPRFTGFTMTEILMAFLVVGFLLLPVFTAISHAVRESERYYTEAFAITHAKGVMDTLMFQIPWRCLKAGNPCLISDPKNKVNGFLRQAMPRMFEKGYEEPGKPGEYRADGLITDPKGFSYRVRVKCIDIKNIPFAVEGKTFNATQISEKDVNGDAIVLKKLILEVRWSVVKNENPLSAANPKKLFLVGLKSELDR